MPLYSSLERVSNEKHSEPLEQNFKSPLIFIYKKNRARHIKCAIESTSNTWEVG
jgi:hypothetical protein